MPDLLSIVVGAAIGILAGPVTELARHSLTRRQTKEDREREFQQETLLALARHLTDANKAATLVRVQIKGMGFPEHWQDDNATVFEKNLFEARHHAPFVTDTQIRELAEEALKATGQSMLVKNEADFDARGKEASNLFKAVSDRIGEKVRGL
jgi:hypothetical protein